MLTVCVDGVCGHGVCVDGVCGHGVCGHGVCVDGVFLDGSGAVHSCPGYSFHLNDHFITQY